MSLTVLPAYPVIVKTEETAIGDTLALQLYRSPSPYRSPSSTSASNNTTLADNEWSEPHIVTFTGYVYLYRLIYCLISGLLYESASGLAWGPHYVYYFVFYLLIDTF